MTYNYSRSFSHFLTKILGTSGAWDEFLLYIDVLQTTRPNMKDRKHCNKFDKLTFSPHRDEDSSFLWSDCKLDVICLRSNVSCNSHN